MLYGVKNAVSCVAEYFPPHDVTTKGLLWAIEVKRSVVAQRQVVWIVNLIEYVHR